MSRCKWCDEGHPVDADSQGRTHVVRHVGQIGYSFEPCARAAAEDAARSTAPLAPMNESSFSPEELATAGERVPAPTPVEPVAVDPLDAALAGMVADRAELDAAIIARADHLRKAAPALPTDSAVRKGMPLARGCLDYFPAALAEVARLSKAGNDKHNPGEEMHHARGKSSDHADCIVRHLTERGTIDTDGFFHDVKVAWRALANLQELLEQHGAPLARGARLPGVTDTCEPCTHASNGCAGGCSERAKAIPPEPDAKCAACDRWVNESAADAAAEVVRLREKFARLSDSIRAAAVGSTSTARVAFCSAADEIDEILGEGSAS